jgi:hypothetical protein
MRKIAIFPVVVLSLLVWSVMAWAQYNPPSTEDRNANGIGYYMLEVPDPSAMVIDGSDDDWAWFDPMYLITMDQLEVENGVPMPDADEFVVAIKMGWSPVPDNFWYCFIAVHDDTMSNGGEAWFYNDALQFGFDPTDHGRGSLREYGQQFVLLPGEILGNADLRAGDDSRNVRQEMDDPPYGWGAILSDPPDARSQPKWTSPTGVDYAFEFKIAVWDQAMECGVECSPRTILSRGLVLPFVLWIEDYDTDTPSYKDITTRSIAAAATIEGVNYFSTATLLGVEDYEPQVAVESSTWGAIKATFQQ